MFPLLLSSRNGAYNRGYYDHPIKDCQYKYKGVHPKFKVHRVPILCFAKDPSLSMHHLRAVSKVRDRGESDKTWKGSRSCS